MIGPTRGWRLERRWVFYGLACLCLLMFSIDMTIVSVALRTIVEDLDTSLSLAAWTLTGFMLTQTVVLPLVGKLGERLGQMRVFIACVTIFTLGATTGWRTAEGLVIGEQIDRVSELYGKIAWSNCIGYAAMSMRTGEAVTSIYSFGQAVYGFALSRPNEPVCN